MHSGSSLILFTAHATSTWQHIASLSHGPCLVFLLVFKMLLQLSFYDLFLGKSAPPFCSQVQNPQNFPWQKETQTHDCSLFPQNSAHSLFILRHQLSSLPPMCKAQSQGCPDAPYWEFTWRISRTWPGTFYSR